MASAFAEAITASIIGQLNPETAMVTALGQKMIENQEIKLDKDKEEFVEHLLSKLKKLKQEQPVDDDAVAYYQKLVRKYQS